MLSFASLPTHAYVPGRTPRHPAGAFDAIRTTARPGMGSQALAQSAAFRTGLRYIDDGFFWEAHELLEPVWMHLPAGSAERRFVQGLIQMANGFLKVRMGRPKAARRLVDMARGLVPDRPAWVIMTVSCGEYHHRIARLEGEINLYYNA